MAFFSTPYLAYINRHSIDFRAALPIVAGGILGVPVGVIALKNLDAAAATAVLGAAVITLVTAQNLLRLQIIGAPKIWKASIVGILAGMLGGVFSLTGHSLHGSAGIDSVKIALAAGPCAFLGGRFGGKLADKTSLERFKRIVNCFLIGLGGYLIIRALF